MSAVQVDSLRDMIENPSVQAGASFKFVDWEPEAETRSACCGDLCEPCTGDDLSLIHI